MAKFQIDLEKLKEVLRKETSVTEIVKNMELPKEAKPYVFNAIKVLQKQGVNIIKVKPGVYNISDSGGSEKKEDSNESV